MYYNARWYDPQLGRFTQADTIIPGAGNSSAWDRYAYTLNNPLRYTDPSGHKSQDPCHGAENGYKCNRDLNKQWRENQIQQDKIVKTLGFDSLLDFQQNGGACDDLCWWGGSWSPESGITNLNIKNFLKSLDDPSSFIGSLIEEAVGSASDLISIRQFFHGLTNNNLHLLIDQATTYIDGIALYQPDKTFVITYTYTVLTVSYNGKMGTFTSGSLTLGTYQDPTHITILLQETQAMDAAEWFGSNFER